MWKWKSMVKRDVGWQRPEITRASSTRKSYKHNKHQQGQQLATQVSLELVTENMGDIGTVYGVEEGNKVKHKKD